MEGLSVASAEDDSAADGSGGGGGKAGGGGGGGERAAAVPCTSRGEETRRCNAPRAARPAASMYEASGGGSIGAGGGGRGSGGGGGHNRKTNQQQQRHQLQQHGGGGKKQKKAQKWKANKYRGRGGGGRKEGGKPEDTNASNGVAGEDHMTAGMGSVSGEPQQQPQSEPGCFHQLQQGPSSSGSAQQQASGSQTLATGHQQQQQSGSAGGTAIASTSSASSSTTAAMPAQKNKHSKQQNLTPMEVRNKRLQSVSKFFLPEKRPRKECIVPPTKFLLGGNISDPLNLNSLQNESENAVTPKSSPIPTPPHYKAKIEVIIPPNINDPLHLLDPVDSVEYEMQLCSPMKRKQRTRNKRKRKSRTATERNLVESVDQLLLPPPPGGDEHKAGGSGVEGAGPSGAGKLEEATTAEEASFTGIGQKLADAAAAAAAPPPDNGDSTTHFNFAGQSSSSGGSTSSVAQIGSISQPGAERNASTNVTITEQDRTEREKAMRNLKLDLESAGGRKRRTSESTNSTKNKLRRMDSMDKIVSPVIPQPGGWKRAHWPPNAGGGGGGGAVGGIAGRNRTRTYSAASNTEELLVHGEDGGTVVNSSESRVQAPPQDSQVQENANRKQETLDDFAMQAVEPGANVPKEGDVALGESIQYRQQMAADDSVELVDRPLALAHGTPEGIHPPPQTAHDASGQLHFGNYDRYYGYHSLNEYIDVRLKVFLRNAYLFRDKDVLDIGCNVGLMTIAIAKMLHPKSATGIDVDGKLVAKARKNLSKYVRVPRTVGRRAYRESVRNLVTTATSMEVNEEEKNANRNSSSSSTIPLECDPLQLSVGETTPQSPRTTTSQTGCEEEESVAASVVVAGATASSVAVTIPDAEVSTADDELPGEPILQSSDVLTEEEKQSPKPPEIMEDQPADGGDGIVPTEAENNGDKSLLLQQRQIRRRKQRRKAWKRRQYQHHHHHHHHHHQQHQLRRQRAEQSQYFPISFPLTMGNLSGRECQMDIGRMDHKFPHNVRFKTMNYVLKDESLINYDTQQYDLILCLSVTKWIHLNYGDLGIKIAFKRMFNHLRPGGKLILEAQNWPSYKKKKKLTATIFEKYSGIQMLPARFHDYLLSPEVGFSHSFPLGIPRHLSKGFRRPIQLYIKGDFTPSQAKWSDTYHPGTPYENHRGIYTDIVTASQTQAGCMWGATTPYAPSYSYRQPPTPSHGGGSGSGSGFASTSPYYNPRQTDSYLPSYDNIGNGHRPGSYCFASPLYSTTWSPPSDMLATSGGGGGSYRRSASNTPNSASIRSADNDEHYYPGAVGGGSQRRHHVYPPIDVLPPLLGYDGMRPGSYRGGGGGGGGGAMTDSDSEPSSNSASQTPTRQQQLAGSFLTDDQSNSPSGHSQPDK
ncbi:7SK snRNA methylphosphate capping enzyme bin3 [Anopheles maculipalpis]|uniref:7SK snRNA methylphosphate capping enzyme bin3 n=1 Tax=Anopheles maculipalpis TaxID=1496333 RepID=UPI0021595013|nr:7SK snRNA methylphosphate capping enzyme bin3 [Anopheles maculipalpis]